MIVLRSNEEFSAYWETDQTLPSIFLAGPTPRDGSKGWRPQALKYLEFDHSFNGVVFVPEPFSESYEKQIGWEWNALNFSTIRLFWVPRELEKMPAFKTNIEFGMFLNCGESDRIVYGRPKNAPKTSYMDWHYKRVTKRDPCYNLNRLLSVAVVKSQRIKG